MNNGTNNLNGNNVGTGVNPTPNPNTPNTLNNGNINPGFTVMLNDTPRSNPTPAPQPAQATPVTPSTSNVVGVNPPPASSNSVPPVSPVPPVNGAPNPTPLTTPTNSASTAAPLNNPASSQTPSIEPAYTNPQTIANGLNSMPGFEDNVVGTTPPISLEPDKQPKKKNNKVLFIILIVALLVAIGGGTYYLLNNTNLFKKGQNITVEPIDFELSIGDTLPDDLNKYVKVSGTDIANCEKNVTGVNLKKAGVYEFEVSCGGTVRKGKITVVDNRDIEYEPVVVYKKINGTVNAQEFAKITNGIDANIEFVDKTTVDTNLKTPGVYTVKVKATSNNGKSIEFDSKLIVLQYDVKKDYNCVLQDNVDIENNNAKLKQTYRFKISDSDTAKNIYGGLTQDIYEITFNNQEEYNKIIEEFKTNNKVTINNIEITNLNSQFDSDNKKIIVTNELDNQALVNNYGAATFDSYSSLSKKFKTQLQYVCTVDDPQ